MRRGFFIAPVTVTGTSQASEVLDGNPRNWGVKMNGWAPPGNPPEHWRRHAEERRAKAKELKDPEVRREMETIAALYDRLAEYAERRMPRPPEAGE
jgi:hypothetical protein